MTGMRKLALGLALALLAAGCGTTVERIERDEVRDLSGRWNDTDSRLVSERMIEEMVGDDWHERYRRREGRPPTVIVGEIRNRSHEHINTETFINDIERALVRSGEVSFVASPEQRGDIRAEREDQDLHAREDTRNPMGREIGADFMLTGSINTIMDVEGRRQVAYYQVDLELISLADNRKVWIGQKEIKKFIKGAQFRP